MEPSNSLPLARLGTDTKGHSTDNVPRCALGSPLLTFDTIWFVMTYLRRQYVFSVMKTCKALYSLGIPLLFRPQAFIRNKRQIKSFYDFMLGNPQRFPNLFPHFRVLSIASISEIDHSEVLMLAEILSHSTHLEKVELGEEIQRGRIGPSDELTSALAHLSQLHSISVADATDTTLDWVNKVDAPISDVELLFYATGDSHEPLPALLSFSSTLTTLRLDFVSFPIDPTSSFCFPNVHTLEVGFLDITPAVTIFRIFPNLKSLDVKMHLQSYHEPPGDNVIHQEHITNKHALEQAFRPLPSLDYLEGEPTDLYRSALICPAMEWYIKFYDEFSIQWLPHLQHYIRPRCLHFTINVDLFEEDPVTVLESSFQDADIATTLERLMLCIAFNDIREGGINLKETLGCLPGIIGRTTIKTLSLEFSRLWTRNSAVLLKDVDIQKLASDIISKTPTLRNLLITTFSGREFFSMISDDRDPMSTFLTPNLRLTHNVHRLFKFA